MRHFRVQNKNQSQNEDNTLNFDSKLYKSLKSIVKLLPFVEFTVNYGFAIQNVWVTMLMITHGNPNTLDSFVWIVPIIIAIFLRPYLVRYIHSINYKVYREINLISICLVLGALGCYLVGLSCNLNKKSQLFRRILQCSVGWTIMDLTFEFCQFLTQKIETSYSQLCESEKMKGFIQYDQQKVQDTSKKTNFQFYGLFLGYIFSLLICWIIDGKTIKQFYKCCKYAYWTVGGLSLITGLRLQIQSYINLPKRQIEDKQAEEKVFLISYDANYYLPGLQQLLRCNFKTQSLLLLHFVLIFINDVIMIYTSMWFSEPKGVKFAKPGEALVTGLKYGSISLILYTVIDNLKINNKMLGYAKYFQGTLILLILFSIMTYFLYGNFSFVIFGSFTAIMNQFYRHTVFNYQTQNKPIFQRCIQIVQRFQKIFILSFMPSIVMLVLERDDIQDCLLWSSAMAALGIIAFKISKKGEASWQQSKEGIGKTVRVDKIQ